MNRRNFLQIPAVMTVPLVFSSAELAGAAPDQDAEARLKWWREARFGMFIHWGLYSVAAGEWKGTQDPGLGEWLMAHYKIPAAEYAGLAKRFNPVKFNAAEWVRIAKEAGMKYMVITAKHHDGFAMYKSHASDFNIVDATPFRRDPIRELAQECARQGVRLCLYYSHVLDWHDPDGGGNNWDFDPSKKDLGRYLNNLVKPQVRELLTNYGPIGLIWFDMGGKFTKEQTQEIVSVVRAAQPACLISGRIGQGLGDYQQMGDNKIPGALVRRDWEAPCTINDTWGFKRQDNNWKPTRTLLRLLVNNVSKNGNYLLNIGPTPEGEFPQPSVDRLAEVGKWMRVNGESIYAALPSPFPYSFSWGVMTSKSNHLYFHVTDWPKDRLVVYGIESEIKSAQLLGGGKLQLNQQFDRESGFHTLDIRLPAVPPHPHVSVIDLSIDGLPKVDISLKQETDGRINLGTNFAEIHRGQANSKKAQLRLNDFGAAVNWINAEEFMSWDFKVLRPGKFDIVLLTAELEGRPVHIPAWEGGHSVRVLVAGQEVAGIVEDQGRQANPLTPRWRDVITKLGQITLPKPGSYHLELRPDSIKTTVQAFSTPYAGLTLRTLRLAPSQ